MARNSAASSPLWISSITNTNLGSITFGATPNGLVKITFGQDVLLDGWNFSLEQAPFEVEQVLQNAITQMQAYLNRQLEEFTLPLDLTGCTLFQKQVLAEVCKIPYGQVITYGQIAEMVGGIKHVRAVGGAVGSNPIPIVIPCHRVVAADGHLRGYSGWGGIRTKSWLLQLEGQQLFAEEM